MRFEHLHKTKQKREIEQVYGTFPQDNVPQCYGGHGDSDPEDYREEIDKELKANEETLRALGGATGIEAA